MKTSRLRIIGIMAALGAALSISAASSASASPHAASNVRSELRAAIAEQLRYNPAGKVIDANQISYDHGAMVVTLAVPGEVSPDLTCSSGYVCFYQKPGLKENGFEMQPAHYTQHVWYSLSTWYPYALLGSVRNDWSNRTFIGQNKDQSSALCYPAHGGKGSPDTDLYWVLFGTDANC
jgi:hypothetical protein